MTSTSVRVALRVRPLNNKETIQNCSECLSYIPDTPQILFGTDRSFTYDYVFPPDTEQEDVFQDCASPLIDKLAEGYNVTILAYGQTGSGKTYSMGTALDSNIPSEHQGIIPRAIRKLFVDLHEKKEANPSFEFEVYVSFLELYNEDLIDLLNPQSREHNKKGKSELMIREDANGQIYWAGVKEVQVSSPEELLGQLQKGSLCRTVASTDMNLVSSRSHAIFSVILKQTKVENLDENKENDLPPVESTTASKRKSKSKSLTSKVCSKFHFVDLAGSERLKRTNAVGDRAKEGIAINGGLLALGNVISALGDESRKVTHIPYRDSKLTRLLQDSLGGNSQTLMLACVSPADSNFMETLNTLKYANRARNIKNKVSVNESYGGNSVEINQLRGQISRLKMEIQTLRAGGCSEEVTRKHEEEIKSLKGELGMTKLKLNNVQEQLAISNGEKNSLLMQLDFNNQDISDAEREHKMKTHHIIQKYEADILSLKNQVADLQAAQSPRKSSLAGTTPGRDKGHIKFSDPFHSSDESDPNNISNNNKENNGEKKGKKKKKRSSKKGKTRADSHFPISNESSSDPPVAPSLSHHQYEQVVDPSELENARNMFSQYADDDEINEEEEEGLNDDNESPFKLTRKLRRRSKTREKLEKAKEQLKHGYLLLKNGGSIYDDPVLSQLMKTPSSTKSESYIDQMMAANQSKEKRRSSSVSFSEIQTIEVPAWQESNPQQPQQQPPTRRTSTSSRSVSFSDQPISPGSTKSSQNSTGTDERQRIALTRMLHQIQADIAVKEQLVSQLERAEQEYTYMKAQYEQKLSDMQETLITLQRDRDTAVKRAQNANTGVSTRDKNSLVAELKARYEHKMKRLIQEIGDLRRKYNEATQSNTTSKNQSETMLKSMRGQIEQLKSDKSRMIKRIKEDAERVREMTERNQREIQNLRRKEKAAVDQKKRLERTSEMQKLMLEKRNKEVLQTNGKLKSVMTLLKRTTTPKSIAKAFRSHKRNQSIGEDGKESRRTSDDLSAIHEEILASGFDKKKLLDEAIYKYISGRQSLAMIDELINRRTNLQDEKKELLEEREKIITSEVGNELDGDAQALDDRIEMIESEITYITARIRALQSEAVRNVTAEQEEHENRKQEKLNEHKESEDKSRKNSRASKEKRLSVILPENATPETSYDIAVSILRNLDAFESQTILESFFKDIVDLRTDDWSHQVTRDQQDKTIIDLRKKLLAMRRAAELATIEYEKKNKELEEALRLDGRSPSPLTPEKRELQMDDIENGTISLFERKLDQALAEVEAAVSSGTPVQSSSRRNSYFFDSDDAAYFSSSPLSGSPMNTGGNRGSISRQPIPPGWLKLQTREINETNQQSAPDANIKRKDSGGSNESNENNDDGSITKRKSLNGRRLKKPTKGSSTSSTPSTPSTPLTPSTPKDEHSPSIADVVNLHRTPLERTRSGSQLERTKSGGQQLERTRSGGQLLERTRSGGQPLSRRGSLRDGSTIISHSRQNSSTSMGFYLESGGDGPRDSGYFSNADKRRSATSMARRGSMTAVHMHSSYGRSSSPDSDDAASVISNSSERRASIAGAHHTHARSETPTGDNVFDRLSKSQTHSSSAKNNTPKKPYNDERRGSVTRGHLREGGVMDALAALEGKRDDYVKSPEPVNVQA